MPILAAEPSLFPESLLDACARNATGRAWWVAYTMARQEKALARHLHKQETPFYLPLIAKNRYVRGRAVCSFVPLFDGYVFLFATAEERVCALRTNRVSRILEVPDQDCLWHDLRQVQRLILSEASLTVEQRLVPGQRVRVRSGVMAGLEGTIISRRSGCRLLIAVDFLQKGVSVTIDDFMVEPLE